jgi:oxygen-independent coproporphyrinogen-3 oxidase
MGLRLAEGIDVHSLEQRFGVPLIDRAAADRLAHSGHLTKSGSRIAATPAGRLLLDRILAEIAA